MDLKQTMIVFALLLGLILSATVGVVYGQTPTPTPKIQPQSVQEQPNEQTITWTDPKTGLVYDIPAKGYYCLDFDEDSICDVDFEDGKLVLYGENESDQETVEDEEASGNEGVDEATGNGGEEWNDSCRNSGYEDGQNGPFAQGTYDHCGEEAGGDDAYYNGFIDGCMDAGNTRDVCEQATDAG